MKTDGHSQLAAYQQAAKARRGQGDAERLRAGGVS